MQAKGAALTKASTRPLCSGLYSIVGYYIRENLTAYSTYLPEKPPRQASQTGYPFSYPQIAR